jgi:hypothetical protein
MPDERLDICLEVLGGYKIGRLVNCVNMKGRTEISCHGYLIDSKYMY